MECKIVRLYLISIGIGLTILLFNLNQKRRNIMKDFSQYFSLEEVFQDAISEGVFPRNRKVHKLFPGLKARPSKDHLERIKISVFERLTDAAKRDLDHRSLSLSGLRRAVRGDNYPETFELAIRELIAERKITEQKLWGKKGRPTTYYHLYEF
jgi:hypothetical protein